MKRIFLFLLMISTSASLLMAASTPVMYVEYFLTANENYLPYIEEVRSAVMDGVGLTQRFTLVDVSSQQSLQIEERFIVSKRYHEAVGGQLHSFRAPAYLKLR